MASAMAGGVLEGSTLRLTSSGRLKRWTGGGGGARTLAPPTGPARVGVLVVARATKHTETEAAGGAAEVTTTESGSSGRRAVLMTGLIAATTGSLAPVVLADPARPIKIGPPPPPSGGLAGTLNSDQARDLELKLKDRFYLQPLPPAEAAQRVREVAADILKVVKAQVDKKAWPYVQDDLRLKGSYLRYDLNTVISAKPKDQKKALKDLTNILFSKIDQLDHAAKIKSTPQAEKYYAETKSALEEVLAKLG